MPKRFTGRKQRKDSSQSANPFEQVVSDFNGMASLHESIMGQHQVLIQQALMEHQALVNQALMFQQSMMTPPKCATQAAYAQSFFKPGMSHPPKPQKTKTQTTNSPQANGYHGTGQQAKADVSQETEEDRRILRNHLKQMYGNNPPIIPDID